MERGWKPNVEISPACPRCGSSNTKFCYYNNYSLTQPRYFCKGCRRYWTKGGSLRNVPVGGGCRKSRRGKPFRASIDGIPSSRVFASDAVLARSRSDLGHNGTPLLPDQSIGSLAGVDHGSNIDLELVYANFLNHKPEPEPSQLEISKLPNAVGSSFDISRIDMDLSAQLSQDSGFVERQPLSDRSSDTHLSNDNVSDNAFYFCRLDSIEKQQVVDHQFSSIMMNNMNNYMLPPLPGEELVSEGMVWSSSDIMFPRQTSHATQSSGLVPQAQDPNQSEGNGSLFNISSYSIFSGLEK